MIKNKIGENAGKVWNALDESRELSINELMKKTQLNNKEIHLALGWLSKENKVHFFETNNETKICLIEN